MASVRPFICESVGCTISGEVGHLFDFVQIQGLLCPPGVLSHSREGSLVNETPLFLLPLYVPAYVYHDASYKRSISTSIFLPGQKGKNKQVLVTEKTG